MVFPHDPLGQHGRPVRPTSPSSSAVSCSNCIWGGDEWRFLPSRPQRSQREKDSWHGKRPKRRAGAPFPEVVLSLRSPWQGYGPPGRGAAPAVARCRGPLRAPHVRKGPSGLRFPSTLEPGGTGGLPASASPVPVDPTARVSRFSANPRRRGPTNSHGNQSDRQKLRVKSCM